jgi:hypothetical protein
MEETDLLIKELDGFKAERERIKALVGRIGGQTSSRQDLAINIVFLLIVVTVFILDFLRGVFGVTIPGVPFGLLEEVALLLISLKIIWMIHRQTKIDHFQFWILNSIEFQLTEVLNKVKELEKEIHGAAGKFGKAGRKPPPQPRG